MNNFKEDKKPKEHQEDKDCGEKLPRDDWQACLGPGRTMVHPPTWREIFQEEVTPVQAWHSLRT